MATPQVDPDGEEERRLAVRSAIIKAIAALVAVVAVILIGTVVMVKALGLNDQTAGSTRQPVEAPKPLPTTALPTPSDSSSPLKEPTPTESASDTPSVADGKLNLSASPVIAKAMERINLSGSYGGQDGVSLQVQRLDGGAWSQFPANVSVRGGQFATYILTGRLGDNQFRVFDPASNTASNPVTITIQ